MAVIQACSWTDAARHVYDKPGYTPSRRLTYCQQHNSLKCAIMTAQLEGIQTDSVELYGANSVAFPEARVLPRSIQPGA